MNGKYKATVFFCVLVLVLASGCEEIKLFWHPEGPAEGPNPFLGSWVSKESVNLYGDLARISFAEKFFSYNGPADSYSGSVTYSGNSATLSLDGFEGGAQITQGELTLSMPFPTIYSGVYIRQESTEKYATITLIPGKNGNYCSNGVLFNVNTGNNYLFASSDSNGNYILKVPAGTYFVTVKGYMGNDVRSENFSVPERGSKIITYYFIHTSWGGGGSTWTDELRY